VREPLLVDDGIEVEHEFNSVSVIAYAGKMVTQCHRDVRYKKDGSFDTDNNSQEENSFVATDLQKLLHNFLGIRPHQGSPRPIIFVDRKSGMYLYVNFRLCLHHYLHLPISLFGQIRFHKATLVQARKQK